MGYKVGTWSSAIEVDLFDHNSSQENLRLDHVVRQNTAKDGSKITQVRGELHQKQ